MIASSNPSTKPDGSAENPYSLSDALAKAPPNGEVLLRGGTYVGEYSLNTPGVSLAPYQGEPARLVGPARPPTGSTKPAWLRILAAANGAAVQGLQFIREGNITAAKAFNDFGMTIDAPDARVENCQFSGMVKGIHVRGKGSTGVTIVRNHIGQTYQSGVVVGTSYGVVRGLLIAWNLFDGSYGEDGIQFTQDFDAPDPSTDVSNLGAVIYKNTFIHLNENAIDLKGAAQIVIDGNLITFVAGSNNGAINGWNDKSPMAITHGAGASLHQVCEVLIRNNQITQCHGGSRVFAGWRLVHNLITDCNWSAAGTPWAGTGILQRDDSTDAAIINNLVYNNRGGNIDCAANSPSFRNNPTEPGPGWAVTHCKGDGHGPILSLLDAGVSTDWFGRTDLPRDVLYLGGERYEVLKVYRDGSNIVLLDRDAMWRNGDPIYWRSPEPVVGLQAEYVPQPEPPIVVEPPDPPVVVEPPVVEIVRIVIEVSHPPAEAAQLRELLAGATMKVE